MTTPEIRLRGMAWNHSRGFTPMVATAQRYGELFPHVEITWEKRSLQAFADAPIEKLAKSFDLLVIDHPFAGFAARTDALLDFNSWADQALLEEMARNTVGPSHLSYEYEGKRCALGIDAATPVSGWRRDLLEERALKPPATWDEVLELARQGLVVIAGISVDCLMNFFMLCHARGEEPCVAPERVVHPDVGAAALVMFRELTQLLPAVTWELNPIRVWDLLAHSSGMPAYCPFAYGYSNYAREGYSARRLEFGGMVTSRGQRLRPTLGGTGIAISSRCRHTEVALDYARRVAGETWQKTLYFDSGGQPAHRAAWLDPDVNRRANDFFKNTLSTMEESWTRPRYPGYLEFQDRGGDTVRDFLIGKIELRAALRELDRAYRASRERGVWSSGVVNA